MFVLSRNVSASYRVIATLVTIAMVMGVFSFYNFAQAANITSVSDLLSDSDRSVDSNHTITFTLPTSLLTAETVVIDFDAANGFDTTGVTTGDFAITATGGTFSEAINTTTDVITFTSTGGTVATSTVVTVTVNGSNKINNPGTTGSYEIDISAGTDSGHTRVAIVDNVDVTAKVNTSFNFTVIANATSTSVNGTTTTRTTSSTTIPFGTLAAGAGQILAQDLTVQTNAINGFVVTVMEDQNLLSSTGADIDNFVQGVTSATPVAWSAPTNNIAQENTWGHWGMTSEDTATTRSVQFASNLWVGVSTTPQVIFSHTGPADGATAGIGRTRIGYKAQITALQEAGDDYSTTLTYVATPTF